MRNIRLDIEYDGTNYCGWQWQSQGKTLEETIKTAIEVMVQQKIVLYSSGRTDAGVHAEQHVAHFRIESTLSNEKFLNGINSLTPPDIVVYKVSEMPLKWSARYDPYEREYRYTFYSSPTPNVFFRRYTRWERMKMDVEAMRCGAAFLVGTHDFSAFRSQHCGADNPVRTIFEISVIEDLPFIHLKVRGQAFLRHQVRIIAGALRKVGIGWKNAGYIKERLESKVRDSTDETLDACGLTLVAVRYNDDELYNPSQCVLTRRFYNSAGCRNV
jgi:tRNA pseudouridine38-40 synthase